MNDAAYRFRAPERAVITVIASAWLDDWYVIERACGGRLCDADIEGTAAEMHAIAAAITARGTYRAMRCAVDADDAKEGVALWSPRNSTRYGVISCAQADALAAAIRITVPNAEAQPA